MTGPAEYELTDEQLNAYYELRELSKLEAEVAEKLDAIKTGLKMLAQSSGAEFLTIDGHRVLQVTVTRPHKFNASQFKLDQPRMYEAYVRQTDVPVVTLRFVGGRP